MDEVTARLDPARYTIKTVPDRSAKRGDPMRDVLAAAIDVPRVLAALEARLSVAAAPRAKPHAKPRAKPRR